MAQSIAEAAEIFLDEQAKERFDHRRMAAFHIDACVPYVVEETFLQHPELVRGVSGPGDDGRIFVEKLLHVPFLPAGQPLTEPLPVAFQNVGKGERDMGSQP